MNISIALILPINDLIWNKKYQLLDVNLLEAISFYPGRNSIRLCLGFLKTLRIGKT